MRFNSKFAHGLAKAFKCAVALVACSIFGTACDTTDAPVPESILTVKRANYTISWVSADSLAEVSPDSRFVVRLRGPEDLVVIDPTRGPIDLDRIDLSCPTAQMALTPWLQSLAEEDGMNLEQVTASRFVIGLDRESVKTILNDLGVEDIGTMSPMRAISQCCEYECYEKIVNGADATVCDRCIFSAPICP